MLTATLSVMLLNIIYRSASQATASTCTAPTCSSCTTSMCDSEQVLPSNTQSNAAQLQRSVAQARAADIHVAAAGVKLKNVSRDFRSRALG
ncbi:hypothetical protein ACOSP7_026369 [Xanthoceras sorbifolium]